MEIGNWYTNPELHESEIKQRVETAQTWVDSIETIVEKTQDVEARQLTDSILSGIAVAQPDAEQYMVPLQGPEYPTVFLFPLFYKDKDISDTTRMMMGEDASQITHYTENMPGRIYLNAEVPLTSLLKSIFLFHEAKHAEIFESDQFRNGNELDKWHEEAAVFDFEFRLLNELGGKPYQDVITNTALRLTMDENRTSYLDVTPPKAILPEIDVLNEIFGPEHSSREFSLRNQIVWMNAVFHILERSRPSTANQDKAKFLQKLYSA